MDYPKMPPMLVQQKLTTYNLMFYTNDKNGKFGEGLPLLY